MECCDWVWLWLWVFWEKAHITWEKNHDKNLQQQSYCTCRRSRGPGSLLSPQPSKDFSKICYDRNVTPRQTLLNISKHVLSFRLISTLWIILWHSFDVLVLSRQNLRNRDFGWKLFLGDFGAFIEIIFNGLPAVDTFFFMSGFLNAYIGLIQLEKKTYNFIWNFIHRYIRYERFLSVKTLWYSFQGCHFQFDNPSWVYHCNDTVYCTTDGDWAIFRWFQLFHGWILCYQWMDQSALSKQCFGDVRKGKPPT